MTNKQDKENQQELIDSVVEGTDNQKEAKQELSKSAQRTEQNLTNTDVANAQNLQYERGKVKDLKDSGEWYKMNRSQKKKVRAEENKEKLEQQKKQKESTFVEQKEDDSQKEEGPNDSQKTFDALQGKKLEPQYIADNNETQQDNIMNKELNKNLDEAKELNDAVAKENEEKEKQKKKQEEQAKKEQKK